ncbi:MAG: PadR family transcriptional regulator [Ignisphaera sp.]
MLGEKEDHFIEEFPRHWGPPPWHHRHWRRLPVRGPLHLLILKLLSEKSMPGGEIREMLKSRFELEVPSPAIYTILNALEEKGFVISSWETSEKGAPRKVYRVTEDGLMYLKERVEDLRKFKKIIEYILS